MYKINNIINIRNYTHPDHPPPPFTDQPPPPYTGKPHPCASINPHLPTPRCLWCDFNLKTEPPHRHIRVDLLRLAEYPVKQEHALSLETETILTHKYACQSFCALFRKYPHLQLCPNNPFTTSLLSLRKEFFNQSLVSCIWI